MQTETEAERYAMTHDMAWIHRVARLVNKMLALDAEDNADIHVGAVGDPYIGSPGARVHVVVGLTKTGRRTYAISYWSCGSCNYKSRLSGGCSFGPWPIHGADRWNTDPVTIAEQILDELDYANS